MQFASRHHPVRRFLDALFVIAFALVLAACGGTSNRDKLKEEAAVSPPTSTPASAAATVEVLTSANTIASAGAEAVVTAFVKTASNVALEGQAVTFSASSGTLQVVSSTSDASGAVSARLTAGSNKALRNITVTVTAATVSGNVVIGVTDSSLSIAGSTSLQSGGAASTYTVRALDSAGNGIPGVVLTASSTLGNTLSPTSATTNSTGTASFSYTPTTAGSDTISVTGLGAQATASVQVSAIDFSVLTPASNTLIAVGATGQTFTVRYLLASAGVAGQTVNFSTTRGAVSAPSAVTNASGDASVTVTSNTAGPASLVAQISGVGQVSLPVVFTAVTPSSVVVQANPSAVQPNSNGSTSNQSAIQAVVRDTNGNAVAGTQVNFTLQADTSGGTLSQGSATTDNNGRAQVQFIPGSSITANNGVVIQAVAGAASGTASLTVSGQALFITLAYGNTISDVDTTTYTKTFSVYVTDANGNAVQNQNLTLSVIPETYFKGSRTFNPGTSLWEPVYSVPAGCPNEDANRNGVLDTGEDANSNAALTPGNVAVVTPGTVTTDSVGRTTFELQYGKPYATWIRARLVARGTVGGTESSQSVLLILPISIADIGDENVAPAGGAISPFGQANACANPL